MGLIEAARRFDPFRGVKFVSYAVWWIRRAILDALAGQGRPVRLPLNRVSDLRAVSIGRARLVVRLGRQPTLLEVAEETGIDPATVDTLLGFDSPALRLNQPISTREQESAAEWFLEEDAAGYEDEEIERIHVSQLRHAVATLPVREARVLGLYYGLEGPEHTVEEIAQQLGGVSPSRVHQVRNRAVLRLREGGFGWEAAA